MHALPVPQEIMAATEEENLGEPFSA